MHNKWSISSFIWDFTSLRCPIFYIHFSFFGTFLTYSKHISTVMRFIFEENFHFPYGNRFKAAPVAQIDLLEFGDQIFSEPSYVLNLLQVKKQNSELFLSNLHFFQILMHIMLFRKPIEKSSIIQLKSIFARHRFKVK